eukprot:scaffold622106_cov21-Prasinocladus_malaysianus.AAC.1
MAGYIAQHPDMFGGGRRVLELGAGVGLPSFVAASLRDPPSQVGDTTGLETSSIALIDDLKFGFEIAAYSKQPVKIHSVKSYEKLRTRH